LCPKDIVLLQNLPKLEERFYLDVSKLNLSGVSLDDFLIFTKELKIIDLKAFQENT
jgi:hypothetical protein